MANEESSNHAVAEGSSASGGKTQILALIPPLLNTVVILITLGFLLYSKLFFKHTLIREAEERKKLAEVQAKVREDEKKVVFFSLDPITVNIASTAAEGPSKGASEFRRLHYVNLGIAFEIRGNRNKELLEALRPYILDQIIFILGKKTYEQLSTIQGRYVLQFQIQDAVNQIAMTKLASPPRDPIVSHTFFNQLIVQ